MIGGKKEYLDRFNFYVPLPGQSIDMRGGMFSFPGPAIHAMPNPNG